MVTATKPVITKEELERYLPYRLKYQPEKDREGNIQEAYRTHLDPESRSGTPVSINTVKGVYYDFKYNHGGSIVSLLRQVGAPISRELAETSQRHYKRELSKLAQFKNQGRYMYGCNKATAVLVNRQTSVVPELRRVMCLKWNCSYCAGFLSRVITEHLADYHAGAIYLIPKGYQGVGKALNRIKQKARRAGGSFEWWLLEANDVQILFVDSRSSHEVINWLKDEPLIELEELNPIYKKRQYWMDKGLELMTKPAHWQHKFRHSRGIPSLKADVDRVDNVIDTSDNNITNKQGDTESGNKQSEWEWRFSLKPLELVARAFTDGNSIYEADWTTPNIVRLRLVESRGQSP